MKLKKLLITFALSSVLATGALFVGKSAEPVEVKATKDLGTFTFADANDDSGVDYMYGINWTDNEAPAGWDTAAFAPVNEESGTFVNGVRVGTEIKKIGPNTYYIPVPGATEGTVATVKGTWANSAYSFTVNEFSRQWFTSKWVYPLEDYDVVSLSDANMPNFENVAINTEDASGYDYVTDPAGLPKKKGFFGLTNSTNSYAFQFKFTKTVQSSGWFDIRIGGSGSWGRGHLLKFSFSNEWGFPGPGFIYEYIDSGDIWNPTEVQKSPEFGAGLVSGENLIEIGTIKVKNLNLYYTFFISNGAVRYGAYWNLDDATRGARTTKIGVYYPNADVSFCNSLEPESANLTFSSYVSGSKQIYFNMDSDICPAVSNWDYYFIPVVADNLKLNGSSIGYSNWNYFKKTGSKQMFLALGDLGITPVTGDILYLGGMFKSLRTIASGGNRVIDPDNPILYKVNFAASYFQFDGTNWNAVNPDYTAASFSKDLLKMTLSICTGAGGNNHDVLVSVWSTLSGSSYYGVLTIAEKETLSSAVASGAIVVPTTSAGVDAMSSSDALAAAMYRYDYCTSKYQLTSFISGRPAAANNASIIGILTRTNTSDAIQIIIAITSVIVLVGVAIPYFMSRRKVK